MYKRQNYRNAGLKTLFEKGDSTESINTLVRQQLALQYGLKDKMDVSQEEMAERWETFHPKMKVQMIMVADEAQANDIEMCIRDRMYVEETDDKNKDKDNSNGKPLTLGKDWINTLVVRLEAQKN